MAMRVNRLMDKHLRDLRSRQVEADSLLPGKWPTVEIVRAGQCFLLQNFVKKPHLSPADFPDPTGLECSANRMRMEGLLDPNLVDSCPLLLLTAGLFTARAVAQELQKHVGRFNVIVSYDGESCAVRFHKVREGERWLAEDLDDYVDEGVLVFEAGGGTPAPAMITGN
jgi:hypothetical protein